MSVFEHLKHINRSSRPDSADERISAYMLKNYSRLLDTSLTKIAKETYTAKGTISKFMTKLTQDGTYESLMYALQIEKNAFYINMDGLYYQSVLNKEDTETMLNVLHKADKVYMFVDGIYQYDAEMLANALWSKQKESKVSQYYYDENVVYGIQNLKENDAVIFFTGRRNIYELFLQGMSEWDIFSLLDETKASKYAVGMPSDLEGMCFLRTQDTSDYQEVKHSILQIVSKL